MKKYTEEELQTIVIYHKLWLSGKGGQCANLYNAKLNRADLYNANSDKRADLSNANLRYADLRYANLRYADLSNAILSNANLRRADLSGAILTGADLSGADLSGADLRCAVLTSANLNGARLNGADLIGAKFDNTLILGKPVNKAPLQLYGLPYSVLITDTMMKIDCQVHSIDAWLAFTVEEIENMDCNAKEFYKNYRKLIKSAVRSHRVPKEENKES